MSEEQQVVAEEAAVVAEEVVEDVAEQQSVPEVDEETLKEAKRQGWVPQEDYTGPQDKWVDADTFVKKGKEINALLRKDNEFLKREVSELKTGVTEFKKFMEERRKEQQAQYERTIAELRNQKKDAISTGDGDLVLRIEDQIDSLKEARQQEKAQVASAPQPDATFIQWSEENKWYTSDAQLKTEADMIGEVIKRQNPTLIGEAFLNEVTTRVKRMYPEKFTNANRSRPSPVESTTAPKATAKAGKAFNDLPPEAKIACQKFEKQGLMSRAEYLKEYFGE